MAKDVTSSWGTGESAWSIVVHGGAGDVASASLPARIEGCKRAAEAGRKVLAAGGSALDAVQGAVLVLEDEPLFNAGTGACLTSEGTMELDASIMEGASLRGGGVCALPPFKNPISIARAVLDANDHVLYGGAGAEQFALAAGFVRAAEAEMITPAARARFEELSRARAARAENWAGGATHGTVGAVARDARGSVASATSTGGRMLKRPGRVGDSPVLGAGTYADDDAGACSNTGDGEAVMRVCLAKTACEWMRARMHPEDAARAAVQLLLDRVDGTGGIILVDRTGRMGVARTTAMMPWGAAAAGWDEVRGGA